jgi:hypothetical protein
MGEAIGKTLFAVLGGLLGITVLHLATLQLRPMITGTEVWRVKCGDCGFGWWQELPIGFTDTITCPSCGSTNTQRLFRILEA